MEEFHDTDPFERFMSKFGAFAAGVFVFSVIPALVVLALITRPYR